MKLFKIQLLFWILSLCVGKGVLCGQEREMKFDRFVVEDGLTSINCITRDHEGFMWFGGPHGLYRYDGYDFKIFTNDITDSTSICGNNVTTLFPDKQGSIWVGTMNSGACLYLPEKEQFTTLRELDNHSVTSICRDHQGLLWIGTLGNGIYIYNRDNKYVNHYVNNSADSTSLSDNDVFDIYEDNMGRVWVVTNSGALDAFDRVSSSFYSHYFNTGGLDGVRTGQKIMRDHQGYFWIGTEGDGLYRFDERDNEFKHFTAGRVGHSSISSNIITGLAEGIPGQIWITTDGGGLNLLNTQSHQFTHYKHNLRNSGSLSNNSSYSLFIDKQQTLWLGMGDGVVNVNKQRNFSVYQPMSFPGGNGLSFGVVVTLFYSHDNKLWIGTGGGGVDVFDPVHKHFKNYKHNAEESNSISSDIILSLQEDKRGKMWIGTFLGGVDVIDPLHGAIEHYKHTDSTDTRLSNDHIFDIAEDSSGLMWFATQGGGLDCYDPQKREFTHFRHHQGDSLSIASDRIQCLFVDKDDQLWVGSYGGGLQRYDRQRGTFISVGRDTLSESLLDHTIVHDISQSNAGMLLVGTEERGMCIVNTKSGYYRSITMQQGLPSNSIYGVFEDRDENIWLCSNKGITKYRMSTGEIINIDRDDGLPTSDFESGAIVQTVDGQLFFGSKKGLISLYADDIEQVRENVDVHLTRLRIFNKSVAVGQKIGDITPLENSLSHSSQITLPYSVSNFSIEFAAPASTLPGKMRYRFKLQGADNRWIETDAKRRIATFSNLDPGEYLFRVQGTNSSVFWANNSGETELRIIVTPPLWRTTWAYLFYAVMFIIVSFFIGKEYIKRMRLRNQLKLEKYKHDKDNEMNLMKIGFFTNMSHELRTPLTLILGPLERLINNYDLDNRARHQLMVIQRNGERLLHLVNQLLDFRKLESGKMPLQVQESDVVEFVNSIILSFKELAMQNNIHFSVKSDTSSIIGFIDKDKVEIIIFNLLSNAFKFTPEKGTILLELNLLNSQNDQRRISISVTDSGRGIEKDKLTNIFELFYQEDGGIDVVGSGIGLSLTKNLVELHHGLISVESELGKGSCFTVELPISSSAYADEDIDSGNRRVLPNKISQYDTNLSDNIISDSAIGGTTFVENNNIDNVVNTENSEDKITGSDRPIMLIVEDNIELNDFLCNSFSSQYIVYSCFNGRQGMDKATEIIPDIIISDIMMSIMDGVELCRNLKQDKRTSHIPIILLTARSAEMYQLEGLENGADDYITKPFSFDLLSARVVNLVESRLKLRDQFRREMILKPKEFAINNPDEQFLSSLTQLLEEQMTNPSLSVSFLSQSMGMSHSVLYRKVMALTGNTISEFIRNFRLQTASQMLKKSDHSISEISDITGFTNPKYFSTCFKKEFGVSPSVFRNS